MDRDEFMELVYETFANEPNNVLANGIIEAADAYVEHEKAQLSCKGITSDTISRQAAIDGKIAIQRANGVEIYSDEAVPVDYLKRLQPIQPEPKEGYWIDKGWNGDWAWQTDGRGNCWRVIVCSECGKNVSTESNYCPHCGAKMKGVLNAVN